MQVQWINSVHRCRAIKKTSTGKVVLTLNVMLKSTVRRDRHEEIATWSKDPDAWNGPDDKGKGMKLFCVGGG